MEIRDKYFIKDVFSLDSYLYFKNKIPVMINGRTVTYKMYQDFSDLLNTNYFSINQNQENQLKIFIHFDENIINDGYYLDINTENKIIIKASNYRGVRYAINVLNNLVEKEDEFYKLPIVLIEDQASFKVRGIIEGYYGEPWSYEERIEMADFMDEFRLNTYMYAPKFDAYHREKWYEPYPLDELNKLITIKKNLDSKGIDFYYCISPGHAKDPIDAFKYVGDTDFNRLFNKLKQLIDAGFKYFGLLLDDIDYKLTGKNKDIFERPGIAHAYICNRVNQFLKENVVNSKMVMCPTEYHHIGSSEYLNDLKNNLNDDIYVYWTGDNVCAEVISESDAKLTKEALNKEIFIWDNYPVSDFTYGVREFTAPIINRTVNLNKYATGYMINPSIHYQISKIGMITMAHYAWNSNKYDSNKSYKIALQYFSNDFYDKGLDYFMYNYPSVLSYGNLKKEKLMVEKKLYQAIKDYYQKIVESAKSLLNFNHLIIEELSPWLYRVIKEQEIVLKIIDNEITKEELISFLNDIKFSGGELLDYLIKDKNLLTDEEYTNLIKKRRGSSYYRVFEYKRWPQK